MLKVHVQPQKNWIEMKEESFTLDSAQFPPPPAGGRPIRSILHYASGKTVIERISEVSGEADVEHRWGDAFILPYMDAWQAEKDRRTAAREAQEAEASAQGRAMQAAAEAEAKGQG